MKNLSSVDLSKSCDSLDPNLRYVEGQSQCGLNDLLQQKSSNELNQNSKNEFFIFFLIKKYFFL
jgi:hypothetical protein